MSAPTPIRVLVADDDPLVRSGLALMLGGRDDVRITAEAADGQQAVAAAGRVDVVLMDVRMPRMDGIEATRAIAALPHPVPVIVLTTFADDDLVLEALDAGAAGYLVKDSAPTDIIDALHAVAAGHAVLSPMVTRTVLTALGDPGSRTDPRTAPTRDRARSRLSTLTDRELEVAVRVAHGDSNAEISARLYMSIPTVKTHMSRILDKTRSDNRVEVALLVHDAGLDT
ncbi:response regulator [Nocardia sp. CA-135398]|uniref:response regulator n=1 Tax=Nocardia sp. CA-135398 TaxID=3239977 RepID=UPI003D95F5B6